jgi:uncharacterized membrane protein
MCASTNEGETVLGADVYRIVLRILHIGAGVAWVGSIFFLVVFLQPATAAIAPQGAPVMRELLAVRKLIDRVLTLAGITIVAGALLYWEIWHDFGSFGDFIGSAYGLWLTIGAIFALVAIALGAFGTRPTVQRLLALGAQAAQVEGPPPPELQAEMGAVQQRLKVLARTGLALLAVSVLAMATAQYW